MNKLILLLLVFVAISLNAQTPLPYYTGFDTDEEQSGWTEFRLGATEPFYLWDYEASSDISAPNTLVHYYPVGGSEETDDWFVSPEFDFSNGATIDSIWTKYAGFGTPFGIDTVALYLLNGSNDPALADSRTLLLLFSDSTYQNDNTWRPRTDIDIEAVSGSSYLAFRYKTIVNWLDVKFDNLYVSGIPVSVNKVVENDNFEIFPNPVNDILTVKNREGVNGSLSIFNLIGELKYSEELRTSKQSINIAHLPKGVYLCRLQTPDGGTTTRKIYKE